MANPLRKAKQRIAGRELASEKNLSRYGAEDNLYRDALYYPKETKCIFIVWEGDIFPRNIVCMHESEVREVARAYSKNFDDYFGNKCEIHREVYIPKNIAIGERSFKTTVEYFDIASSKCSGLIKMEIPNKTILNAMGFY